MEIKIKVPHWVQTDDEGICMLFAFLRRIAIEFETTDTPLDVYGSDIRKIVNRKGKDIHQYIMDHVDLNYCKIARLNREHFVFQMKHVTKDCKIAKVKEERNMLVWAYLMGCSNYNLLEAPSDSAFMDRPQYTPMYRLEREVFEITGDEL